MNVPAPEQALDELGATLHRLARRLDGLLLDGGADVVAGELKGLRLLTTDALHTLGAVVDAAYAQRVGGRRLDRALRVLAADFGRATGTAIDVRVRGDVADVPAAVADVVLEVVRETFSVSRHARSTVTVVSLVVDNGRLAIEVVDDGIDLAQRQAEAWRDDVDLGLRRVARAIASADGRLDMATLRPRGLRLRAVVPASLPDRP